MGYKCPVCQGDFGRDVNAWKEHLKMAHEGVGKNIVDGLRKIAGERPAVEDKGVE